MLDAEDTSHLPVHRDAIGARMNTVAPSSVELCGSRTRGGRLALAAPAEMIGVDSASAFVAHARAQTPDARARFETASALQLPFEDAVFDSVVSGLVVNLLPDPAQALGEMRRVTSRAPPSLLTSGTMPIRCRRCATSGMPR